MGSPVIFSGTSAKTLTADIEPQESLLLSEISTPSNPPTDKYKIYAKSDGNIYYLDDSGTERQLLVGAPRFETKSLSGNFQTASATITDLSFSNLATGVMYMVILQCRWVLNTAGSAVEVDINHNSSVIGNTRARAGSTGERRTNTVVRPFIAAASSVTFTSSSNFNTNLYLEGDGTSAQTHATLIEVPSGSITTVF